MKFKKNVLAVNLLLCAFLIEGAQARIVAVRTPKGPASGQTEGSVVVKESKPINEKTDLQTGVAGALCGMDQNKSKYFPLSFFELISKEGVLPTFEIGADNKINVSIPAILDGCGKFKPLVHQDDKTKNVTIMMGLEQNDYFKEKKWEPTYGNFLKCLEEKKILVDGKIDHSKLEGKHYSQYPYEVTYKFDKKADIKNTVKLSFGSPKSLSGVNDYPPMYGQDTDVKLPTNLCVDAEKLAEKPVYLNKGQDVLIEEINEVCKSGDAQKIAEARKSLGNADALKDISERIQAELDGGYLLAVKKDVEVIEKEMTAIEDRITKNSDTITEAQAKKEAARYAELAKELDKIFLTPAIRRLDKLMLQRETTKDPSEALDAIDKEIGFLNKDIRGFAIRADGSGARTLNEKMRKFALTDSARTIEDIRLKSYVYSKVNVVPADRTQLGKSLTFEQAHKQQVTVMERFNRTLGDWTDQYLVSNGNLIPYQRTAKERQGAVTRMNSRWAAYQKKEQSDYHKYCAVGMLGSVKNPIQCKSFIANVDKRRKLELRKRDKDLNYIKGKNEKLTSMERGYTEYQDRKMASMEDEIDYDPSSYSSHEDSFSDRYPEYFGAQNDPTAYDGSMYSMNGGQQNMFGGQQNMMMQNQMMMQQNPMMMQQNPMMMQQNPMMMQQQYGGWTGI
jgi:hypothetical protein